MQSHNMGTPEVIIAVLIALGVVGTLFTLRVRRRRKRDSQEEIADRPNPNRFDTTLGEFHDMREALRPLQHTRAASRRVPADRK